MNCSYCKISKAKAKCANCKKVAYCGRFCQEKHWYQNHKNVCAVLIEGRKRAAGDEEDTPLCKNGRDPITMEDFEGMDKQDIIVLKDFCYHLPSLYHWVVNKGHNADPLTNLPFSDNDVMFLKDEAKKRYPLTVTINEINKEGVVIKSSSLESSSLASPAGLFIQFPAAMGMQPTNRLYAFLKYLVDTGNRYIIGGLGNNTSVIDLLQNRRDVQFADLYPGKSDMLILVSYSSSNLPFVIQSLEKIRSIMVENEWPTDAIDEKIQMLREKIRRMERAQRESAAMEEFYRGARGPDPVRQNEDDIQLYVSLIVAEDTQSYGLITVFIPPNAFISAIENAVREQVGDILDLPNRPMSVIYAGRQYNRDVLIGTMPGLQNGSAVYLK